MIATLIAPWIFLPGPFAAWADGVIAVAAQQVLNQEQMPEHEVPPPTGTRENRPPPQPRVPPAGSLKYLTLGGGPQIEPSETRVSDPGTFGITIMGTGLIPILQGDSYFVSRGGPGILSPPGGINWAPGSPGGSIGNTMGGILGLHSPNFLAAKAAGMVPPGWSPLGNTAGGYTGRGIKGTE